VTDEAETTVTDEADEAETTVTDEAETTVTDEAETTATDEAETTVTGERPLPGDTSAKDTKPSARRLEEEGDVAADYLEELLDIVDLDGDIDIDVENGRASVSVVGDKASMVSLRRLAGRDGAVLEALQELTRLAVQAKTGERTRLMLDVAGFRSARKSELEAVARRAIEDATTSGEPVRLAVMTPFERKVVHDVVAAAGLSSESEGFEPSRRVVVQPA